MGDLSPHIINAALALMGPLSAVSKRSVLGVLLLFAGGQLALTLIDVNERKDLFVALIILGITLASNLAAGFIVGTAIAYAFRWKRLTV